MATKNNWFNTNLVERTNENLCDFQISLNPYEVSTGTFKENCIRSAQEIYSKYDNIYLCYSGGIDSEFVLKLFIELKLNITPVIVSTPYNARESSYAFKFCKDNNIKPEILEFSKTDIIDRLYKKSCSRGFFALLGGLPLLVCDSVNSINGSLLTGYGDPFTVIPNAYKESKAYSELEFSEWDYYLDAYDNKHPSGFFTYDQGVLYSLTNDINYSSPLQKAKCSLYEIEPRIKMFWDSEFYQIFREIKTSQEFKYNSFIPKQELYKVLTTY